MKGAVFISPTKGPMALERVYRDIIEFVEGDPKANYRVIVGSDSQVGDRTCFVTAVIVHQVSKGARYYYRKKWHRKITSLRQKIFFETALSLETASYLANCMATDGRDDLNIEIHLDIGQKGDTRELIREIVGMVVGSGFDARIKPDSSGASKVANRFTK